MITKKMQQHLLKYASGPSNDDKTKIKHCVYMNRMQKRIDRELKMMLWLAINKPAIFLNDNKPFIDENGKSISHGRLKVLIKTMKAINPKMDLEFVMKSMEEDEVKRFTST